MNIPNIHKNTIIESRNASLFEDVFPSKFIEEPSSSKRVLETINENSLDKNEDSEVELRHSKREKVEIYMERLKGFSAPGQERKVCKLVKSLYRLKQASKQ